MELMAEQVRVLTDELNGLRAELVNVKAAHATLHQHTSEAGQMMVSQGQRLEKLESKDGSSESQKKLLIEPKNVQVDVFAGAVTDSRAAFIQWSEKVRDRC